jgi:Uma2 family endonuclease
MPDDGHRYELVRGELRRMSPGGEEHGFVAMEIGSRLAVHVKAFGLGRVYAAETGFLVARAPDTVLAPDVAFVRKSRAGKRGRRGWFRGPPDLAIEVRSPGDSLREVAAKARSWLAHGCPLVWTVDTPSRTVTVDRPLAEPQTLGEADLLDGGDVVPGFSLRLRELFAG